MGAFPLPFAQDIGVPLVIHFFRIGIRNDIHLSGNENERDKKNSGVFKSFLQNISEFSQKSINNR